MKKSKADKWVKALLSGKYRQGQERLKDEDNCYCCLGVLGEINKVSEFNLHGQLLKDGFDQEKCGIRTPDGTPMLADDEATGRGVKLKVDKKIRKFDNLAAANDSGASFKSIAGWIKKNYKYL